VFPVFAKKNESFSFADEHAGAASSVQTFLKANLVAAGPGFPISFHEMLFPVVPFPLPIEIAPADATVRLAVQRRKQRPPARERHRYP